VATGDEQWVRTLGGVVGKVGQIVDGEAVFSPGHASLLFLRPGPVGALDVTARGQGQFPLVAGTAGAGPTAQQLVVVRSHAAGALLPQPASSQGAARATLASDILHGHPVDEAIRTVAAAWTSAHAP
jgi:hypothetical protein